MNNDKSAVAIELLFNKRQLTGLSALPDDYYWFCSDIFECDESELIYEDIKSLKANDIPQHTFIYFPCALASYRYCNSISLGRSEQALNLRLAISFNFATWQENINLAGFFELLHDDVQQSPAYKVSDCYHDEHGYLLEVEFTGNLIDKLDEQIQRALLDISKFHNFNIKNVI